LLISGQALAASGGPLYRKSGTHGYQYIAIIANAPAPPYHNPSLPYNSTATPKSLLGDQQASGVGISFGDSGKSGWMGIGLSIMPV